MNGLEKLPALLATQDWAAAERLLRRAARAPRADASVLYNLGRVLIELGDWRGAQIWLKKAVAARPSHAAGWFELGRCAIELGDLPLACTGFEKALALDPADGDARHNLGRVALRLGRYELAREAWAPLDGQDAEAEAALYRIAAETRAPEAEARRRALLARQDARALALTTLGRVSKGKLPLVLRG